MTKQEEIREGIAKQLRQWSVNDEWYKTKLLLEYLHSQDVVLKVDRELPPLISREVYDKHEVGIAIEQVARMVDAGYAAVEPLIKE